MKGIVLYKSKYGHTLRYATWLSEALDWELRELSDFKKKEVGSYESVVFGTGVYMNRMKGIGRVKRLFRDKPITIFACGGNDGVEEEIERIRTRNLSRDEQDFHAFFYLPGGLDFTRVKGPMGWMMRLSSRMIEKKKNRTQEEEDFLKGFNDPTDLVDRKHIEPILDHIRKRQG
ncbi:MAG: flavodoxin domain-containing protein [Acholeplasmataceae bacterium]